MEFKFKQFNILQSASVFKIGTDAVILGAWANIEKDTNILDIGSGTGIVSLMMAQRNSMSQITAIDIQHDAAQLTALNFQNSIFKDRLQSFHSDLHSFTENNTRAFDHIVANPPYFSTGKKSTQPHLGIARHNDSLPMHTFWEKTIQLSTPTTKITVIYPPTEAKAFVLKGLELGWNLNRRLNIFSTAAAKIPIRVALQWSQQPTPIIIEHLTIQDKNGIFTPEFIHLTKDFYLAF